MAPAGSPRRAERALRNTTLHCKALQCSRKGWPCPTTSYALRKVAALFRALPPALPWAVSQGIELLVPLIIERLFDDDFLLITESSTPVQPTDGCFSDKKVSAGLRKVTPRKQRGCI